jgi:hypothetical protein
MIRRMRRVGAAGAVVVSVMVGTQVVSQGAASASGCHRPGAYFEFSGSILTGQHWQYCYDPDSEIPWPVIVERYDPPPLGTHLPWTWVIVAESRSGTASYTCRGTGPYTFRIRGTGVSGFYACS